MSLFVFQNNVSTTNANAILTTDTSIVLATGTGAQFPAITAGHQAAVTVEDVNGNIEVMYATGITGDTLTVTRAQEGTTALAFASGSRVEMRVTNGMLSALLQKNGGDTLTGTTTLNGVLALGGSGSIQGGEFTGALRGAPGLTGNQILVPSGGGGATAGGSLILTASNLAGNLPSGTDLCHTNLICLWNGISSSVPTGWHICDGTNGTPDLRDRFVVGAGTTYSYGSTGNANTGSTDPAGGLTIAGHALTIAEMPTHNHTFWTGGYGFHSAVSGGYSSLINGGSQQNAWPTGEPEAGTQIIGNAGSGNAHTHGISGSLAHTHTYSLPPYYGLFYIMKS